MCKRNIRAQDNELIIFLEITRSLQRIELFQCILPFRVIVIKNIFFIFILNKRPCGPVPLTGFLSLISSEGRLYMYFLKGLVLKNTIISKLTVPKVHNNVKKLMVKLFGIS